VETVVGETKQVNPKGGPPRPTLYATLPHQGEKRVGGVQSVAIRDSPKVGLEVKESVKRCLPQYKEKGNPTAKTKFSSTESIGGEAVAIVNLIPGGRGREKEGPRCNPQSSARHIPPGVNGQGTTLREEKSGNEKKHYGPQGSISRDVRGRRRTFLNQEKPVRGYGLLN